ncbi:hypothetical protein [Catellatospora methionotrophica]|uniref:hypothetical protein n=1 Tax=Catellatospora methionotrophica TaxID=121620 RepID=UPI00140E4888|nr:hypothetical protein [Catellatospora methionotrophica]
MVFTATVPRLMVRPPGVGAVRSQLRISPSSLPETAVVRPSTVPMAIAQTAA